MIDENQVRDALVTLLMDVAAKAKADSASGVSDIASIYRRDNSAKLTAINVDLLDEAIRNIEKATSTKDGARRVVNAIMAVARTVAQLKQ